MQQLQQGTRNLTPSYVQKFTVYLQPTGELVLLIGNQFLQVTANEVRDILEYTIGQGQAFTSNGNGGNSHEKN